MNLLFQISWSGQSTQLSCVTRKYALRSLSLSYPKKDWRVRPCQSFFGNDTDYKIVYCCLHRVYSAVSVILCITCADFLRFVQIFSDFYGFLGTQGPNINPYKSLIRIGKKSIHPYPIRPNPYYLKIRSVLIFRPTFAKFPCHKMKTTNASITSFSRR